MKKTTSIILALSMMMALCTTAIAAEPKVQVSKEAKELAEVYTIETEFSTIKQNANGSYAMDISTETEEAAVPVGRLDIRLWVQEDVDNALARADISKEVKAYIAEKAQEFSKPGAEQQITLTLFSQDLLPQTRSVLYHTYNGMEMKSDKAYMYNTYSGTIWSYSGSDTPSVTDQITSIDLLIDGTFSKSINIYPSLLGLFENDVKGTVNEWDSRSEAAVSLRYDSISQWTYGNYLGGWQLGYASQQVTINSYTATQQYKVNGKLQEKTSTRSPYITVQSYNFASPWATAYSNLNFPISEWISCRINGTNYYFE